MLNFHVKISNLKSMIEKNNPNSRFETAVQVIAGVCGNIIQKLPQLVAHLSVKKSAKLIEDISAEISSFQVDFMERDLPAMLKYENRLEDVLELFNRRLQNRISAAINRVERLIQLETQAEVEGIL